MLSCGHDLFPEPGTSRRAHKWHDDARSLKATPHDATGVAGSTAKAAPAAPPPSVEAMSDANSEGFRNVSKRFG